LNIDKIVIQRNENSKRRKILGNIGYIRFMSKIATDQLTKLYYSIGEVAEMLEVNTSLIRFWEKEFPIIKPKKNKKGNRLYTPKEIAKLDRIYVLVKEQGFTLEGAKKAMKKGVSTASEESTGSINNQEIINRLERVREKLISLKN
jgi:DNA-binding transcriptional MerR regulator